MAIYQGIDVSAHQGTIDWEKVRTAGKQFAMLRDGYGRYADQKDRRFEENYKGAKAAGIPVGAYHYSYASDEDGARKEAEICLKFLEGKRFEYPIAYDVEEPKHLAMTKEALSRMILAFCETVEAAGYYVCIYSSYSWLRDRLDMDLLRGYDVWLAHWASSPGYSGRFGMWQYTAKGAVSGITGNVDLDVSYKDYPAIMKHNGLNGYVADADGTPVFSPEAGERVVLQKTPLYRSSTAKTPTKLCSGAYYFYDGQQINRRYRITNKVKNVGKKPVGLHVTGWVDRSDLT